MKGVAPGGGIGAGVGYDFPSDSRWETKAEAVLTMRRFWSTQFDTRYSAGRARVDAYARTRRMPQLGFFGPGTHSRRASRTSFTQRDVYYLPRWTIVDNGTEKPQGRARFRLKAEAEASRFIRRLREKIDEGLRPL